MPQPGKTHQQSQTRPKGTPLSRAMQPINTLVEQWTPTALFFGIALTFVVATLAFVLTPAGPLEVLGGWGEGLSGLLEFMTQMALVLMLGHMLAHTGPVSRLLDRLAAIPRTPMQAYLFVFMVAGVASLITWGLGLVVGALMAKEVAKVGRERGLKLHFPMLVAAGFSGFVVWHMGYSGSGPLTAATADSIIAESLHGQTIPVTRTIFSTWNLLAIVATLLVVGLALFLIAPRDPEQAHELPEGADADPDADHVDDVHTPADRLDASRIPTTLIGLALVAYLVLNFVQGGGLSLDIVNWSFLALILLLSRNGFEVLHLTKRAAANVGDILLQFPLYAGILGIMETSGLIELFSNALVSVATPTTFGVLALISAGVTNFFVPSGGGQFAVQAPIMLDAANRLGVDPAIAIMAVSYGDQWTNMIQPFWALPLLAIAGLRMRDILGYTTVSLIASGIVFTTTLLLVSM